MLHIFRFAWDFIPNKEIANDYSEQKIDEIVKLHSYKYPEI